ncbi:hypothetical protein SNOG_00412 [Parastagonospora nodorum SN15]|uniref:Uncharacterized protein n=1 Tax=Phaeosphaeria nodorum (strain SN15 / ATCC MYA-4574 / FGSC 10173) TaxID=321614 RepID=Q0V6F2_PHANO|nr:hypothetical protein SNOG_00412 [Parastagonospora nodorum SN15]EAT91907.1 hypothetical protein SNOG_00412 [Parastagonospora nodorum SN15]
MRSLLSRFSTTSLPPSQHSRFDDTWLQRASMCKWMWCGNLVQSSMHARVTSAKRDWHQMYSVTTMEKQGAIFHILIVNREAFHVRILATPMEM